MDFSILEIDWLMLLGATVVLLLPATLLYPNDEKERLVQLNTARFRLERVLVTWQHWLDLVRAFVGVFLLTLSVHVPESVSSYHYEDLVVIASILVAGVCFQTIHRHEIFYFTAPVFYLWGFALALTDWIPAVFAILFSAIIGRLMNNVELKLPLMAGLLGVAGYLVSGLDLRLVLTVGLIVLPVVLAFASMHHLVCYSRAAR